MGLSTFLHDYSILIIVIYALFISMLCFALMGADKRRAMLGWRRLPERLFFILALLGGSAGVLLGMQYYNHKTDRKRHPAFNTFLPFLFFLQLGLVVVFFVRYFT